RYKQKVWIMNIQANAQKLSKDNIDSRLDKTTTVTVRKPMLAEITKTFLSKDPPNSKLIQKADDYFDKMWYAEAAELYELVLSESKENYTYEIIQKAGDSHYFNSNMERAYHWYDILYTSYKNEVSAENIFKYAHSLKGTGKYARAKRLMRLYDKKLKKEGGRRYALNDPRTTPKEKVLDNILATEQPDYTIRNIATNSEYSDFSPMFYNEDELVFASAMDSSFFSTRRYKWNNQPYLDLYVAKVNKESQEVKNAIKFSKKINTKYHEASVTFSPDNKTMYFTRNNYGKKLKRDKNGVNNLKIYSSKKVDGQWTEARELPFNSDAFSTGHPALSPDGKQLYFVSDRPGSLGETDLFVVDVLGNGSFSEPRNLGPEINTERKEMFPYVNDKKLYFSSNGHVGLGGLDVYEVPFDEENGFGEVKNMGKPVNSKKDDFSFIVNEETQKGFFASNRRGGKGDDDIYSFSRLIPEEINYNAIAGVVTELVTGDVMPEALVTLLDENNIKLKEVIADKNGSFVFEDLDGTTKYTIRTTKDSYAEDIMNVSTKDNELIDVAVTMTKLAELIVIEEGIKKLKLDMIFFDFDKAYIRSDAADELNRLVSVMKENPTMVIKIESHTDSRGSAVYNKYLSDRRAKSTRNYIISKGIDPKRIESAIGYGEERLLNECDGTVRCSREKHQLNRRSEFIILNM
ncbi:MAG: OmpA family protein, partial [Muriicola sp.]|nr:OmpA family protein [Muriicola sp.]